MASHESNLASSHIGRKVALDTAWPILKNEASQMEALQLTRRLSISLQRPQTVPLTSILVSNEFD